MKTLQSIKQRFGIIGSSDLLNRALEKAMRVAPTDLTVLITGESGVGKEAFSKIIHSQSARKHSKLIAVNCGAIPEGTRNSELFGHVKGAFTGSAGDRKGWFETVNGGTIFLDEIGEIPLDAQANLLRVLENGEFIPVGSSEVKKTDVRVIAATNKNLLRKMEEGKFREDLYYRLSTVPIYVPSLKERAEDIPLLFRKFAGDNAEKYRSKPLRLNDDAVNLLKRYRWPGNIRELKNLAERMSVLVEEQHVDASVLKEFLPGSNQRNLPAMATEYNKDSNSFQEREILYKLLFEMNADLKELKQFISSLVHNNNLEVGDLEQLQSIGLSANTNQEINRGSYRPESIPHEAPIEINKPEQNMDLSEVGEVVENLSLEDMERDMIQKALSKHNKRRKEAASELGISERTLYRKIKQYAIEE